MLLDYLKLRTKAKLKKIENVKESILFEQIQNYYFYLNTHTHNNVEYFLRDYFKNVQHFSFILILSRA